MKKKLWKLSGKGIRDMDKRKIGLGLLLLVIGIFALFFADQKDAVSSIAVLMGGAFILLYVVKKKLWALLCASVALVYGLARGFEMFIGFGESLAVGLLFFAPGVILLWRYAKDRKEQYLAPGCFGVSGGFFMALMGLPVVESIACVIFFYCFGGFFLLLYSIGKGSIGKWSIGAAVICFFVGSLLVGNSRLTNTALPLFSYAGSIVLIGVSVVLLIKSTNKKQ